MTQTASALTPDSMAGRISIALWKTTCRRTTSNTCSGTASAS
ncbi:hypothetical protein ACVS9P_08235 [Caproicibacterium sp. NSD3]